MATAASPGTWPGLGCRVAHVPTSWASERSPGTRAATGEASLPLARGPWLLSGHWEAGARPRAVPTLLGVLGQVPSTPGLVR